MSKSHTDIEAIIKVRAPPTSANNIVLDYIMSNKVELSKDYDRDEDNEPESDLDVDLLKSNRPLGNESIINTITDSINVLDNSILELKNNIFNLETQKNLLKSKLINFEYTQEKPLYVLTMCFYDKNEEKRKLTIKMLKYYKLIKKKLNNNGVNIRFVLVGSEKDVSKQMVLDAGFDESEYFEFKQFPFMNPVKIIETKYTFAWKKAVQTYPNLSMLITNGSSDFIPMSFFEKLVNHDVNYCELKDCDGIITQQNRVKSEPFLYSVQNYKLDGTGGFVTLINSTYDDMIILNKVPQLKSHQQNLMKSKFVGGIYALNRELLENINFLLNFENGNEYALEEQCIKMGKAKCISLSDFFVNWKIKDADVTSLELIKKLYGGRKYIYNNPRMLQIWKDASELDEFLKILEKL